MSLLAMCINTLLTFVINECITDAITAASIRYCCRNKVNSHQFKFVTHFCVFLRIQFSCCGDFVSSVVILSAPTLQSTNTIETMRYFFCVNYSFGWDRFYNDKMMMDYDFTGNSWFSNESMILMHDILNFLLFIVASKNGIGRSEPQFIKMTNNIH